MTHFAYTSEEESNVLNLFSNYDFCFRTTLHGFPCEYVYDFKSMDFRINMLYEQGGRRLFMHIIASEKQILGSLGGIHIKKLSDCFGMIGSWMELEDIRIVHADRIKK